MANIELTAGTGITVAKVGSTATVTNTAQPRTQSNQAQAEAGTDNTTDMSPLRVAQAIAAAKPTTNAQTGTTYTLVAGDNNKIVTLTNASAITLTVPSGLGAGFSCMLIQGGAGQVTITGSGATVNNRQSHTKIAGQHGIASLIASAANTFYLGGDTAS